MMKKKKGGALDDDDSDFDDMARDMYKKKKALPGQREHCELCDKLFTVTPYTKAGPDGGLLCLPCGKELEKDAEGNTKVVKKPQAGNRQRRKMESDRLDGLVNLGPKSLVQMCIQKVVKHAAEIDELGDLPDGLLDRLVEIFSKERKIKQDTLPLFLRPDKEVIAIHDAAGKLL
jgi:DNA repair protein RAD7